MYSLMSIWIRASSSPNMNSASVLASRVLPTPVGPAKRNTPVGRLGSFSPLRLRRTAFDTCLIGSSWLITRTCISSSICSSRTASSLESRVSGIPVILATTSATTSASTTPSVCSLFSRHSCVNCSRFFFSLSAWSRRLAAFSKSWLATASSLAWLSRSVSSSSSFRSGGRTIDFRRMRAPDSSITSIALSGRQRPVI